MKRILKSYRHLIALLAVIVMAAALVGLGLPAVCGLALVGCWQLSQLAMSKRRAVCFNTGMTPEQIKEFEGILKELSQYKDLFPSLKDLGGVEGGFAAIKALPGMLKGQQQITTKLQDDLAGVRRVLLSNQRGNGAIRRANGVLEVTDECARHLGGIALIKGMKSGQIKGDRWEGVLKDIFGEAELKTALTTSDIPLPTEWSGQVVELVSEFGTARRYGTVFPLGAGTVKLPRLGTDTAFGLIAMSATVTEKSPTIVFVTFTAEKYGGLVRVPSEIDEDSVVAIGQFIARYAARQIAREEDLVFWTGNGTTDGDPEGLTVSTITNSKVTQMAATKTHYSDATLANLRTLRSVPDAAALRTAAYYMHPTFEQHLAGLNTAGDKPYNPQAQIMGSNANPMTIGPTLDGFPIRWIDIMPAFSTGVNVSKVFILFGDASFQYLGVRGGIRFDTSTEAGFTTDEILIRALERFTIGLMALGAVAGLQTAAS